MYINIPILITPIVSQFFPTKPVGQVQLGVPFSSTHVPPLEHGFLAQASDMK